MKCIICTKIHKSYTNDGYFVSIRECYGECIVKNGFVCDECFKILNIGGKNEVK